MIITHALFFSLDRFDGSPQRVSPGKVPDRGRAAHNLHDITSATARLHEHDQRQVVFVVVVVVR